MRDLFQVVFALKKKEIELAKQHLDKSRYSTSPLFSERSLSSKVSFYSYGGKFKMQCIILEQFARYLNEIIVRSQGRDCLII